MGEENERVWREFCAETDSHESARAIGNAVYRALSENGIEVDSITGQRRPASGWWPWSRRGWDVTVHYRAAGNTAEEQNANG